MMKIVTVVFMPFIVCIGALTAWGQPFDCTQFGTPGELDYYHIQDTDFQPVELPDWVWQSPVHAFDQPDWDMPEFSHLAALGVQVMHNHGIKPYWPLKKDDPLSGVEPATAAFAKARIDKAHSLGMRYCYGVYPWAPIPLLKLHPEWAIHRDDNDNIEKEIRAELGDTIAMDEFKKLEHLCVMCFNSPYADYYIECLAEIVRDFGMDGISFDGNYPPGTCYCKFCKDKYRKDTGKEIPPFIKTMDLEYRKYLLWAHDQHEAFFARMHKRFREVNPEFAFMSWSVNAGRWGHMANMPSMSRRLNLLLDCPLQEWWLDEAHRGPTVVPAFGAAYGWAVTNHRCAGAEAYAMSHWEPYGADSFPEHEALRRSMLVLTNGSFRPVAMGLPFSEAVIKEVARRAKWQVRAQPRRWAAVLMSEQSRVNYGLNRIEERYLPFPLGVFRAAYEEHLPLTIITEWNLRKEDLAQYAVVFLPNAACLSNQQMEAIRQYVADGGGLIASCDTSLFDEIGRPRSNFGLADVFGVQYQGRVFGVTPSGKPLDTIVDPKYDFSKHFDNTEFWKDTGGIATIGWEDSVFQKDTTLNQLCPGHSVNFKGRITYVGLPQSDSEMLLTVRRNPWTSTRTCDLGNAPIPGAFLHRFGKGRVIYLAAGIDGAYYSYSFPYQRRLLTGAMHRVASRSPDIRVEAPMCVQTTFFEQSDPKGRRILVHLFNDINTTSNHGDPVAESPLREETIPIAGIKVHFDGCRVKQFHIEPEGKVLKAMATGTIQTVEIPVLEMHMILVAEQESDIQK